MKKFDDAIQVNTKLIIQGKFAVKKSEVVSKCIDIANEICYVLSPLICANHK